MKGVVKFELGPQGVEYREMPEPVIEDGEIKIKVLAAGICGSDIHALHDSGGRKVNMPGILGHEFVGQVTEAKGDTGEIKVGDWVTAAPACYSCGHCKYCKEGMITLCPERASIGTHRHGAMANYVKVPAKYAFKLPEEAKTLEDKKIYALAEPFCCIVRGVYEQIDVKPGDVVVVSGPGPMGMMAAGLFKSRGAYVIVSGLPADAERLQLCKDKFGVDETATSFEELKEKVYAKNPLGADITCDVAAVAPSINNCFAVLASRGVHLQIGIMGKPVNVDLDLLFAREANYVPTNSTAVSTWHIGMKLIKEKAVDLSPLLTMQLPLEQWREGFDAVANKTTFKAILLPDNKWD